MKYFYVAKKQDGEVKTGEIEGIDDREVTAQLRSEGFWVTSLKPVAQKKNQAKGSFFDIFTSVPLKSKMIFCRHLAVMMSSGLSLSRALNILENQEKNATFKEVIKKVEDDVKKGVTLADSIARFPRVFNSVFVSMIKVGELSGNLEEILNILADQLEKDHKLVSKIRGAMIYPSIIFVVMIMMGILMMIFVVPKITKVFDDFDAELPFLTQMIIGISNFMAAHAIIVIGGFIGLVVGLRFFSQTLLGKQIFHQLFLKLPVVGDIVIKVNSARFSRILSSLLGSGVSLIESLTITSDTLGNYYYKKATKQAAIEVQRGITLSEVLMQYQSVFPFLVIQMVQVGEETGKTGEVLIKLAEFYEEEVEQITKNLSSIIEPVLMVLIGGAVGVFAVSIIQPIYSIMGQM